MMQASPPPRRLGREHSAGLSFPTLPEERDLSDLLDHSSISGRGSLRSMASYTDESSVDGNVSSVGESTWDLVDEASVASEDASNGPFQASRHTDEGIESVHLTNESFSRSGEVLSTPSEDSDHEEPLSRSVQFKTLEASQATPRAMSGQEPPGTSHTVETSQTEDYLTHVKVNKVLTVNDATGITSAYAEACTFDEKLARLAISQQIGAEGVIPQSGRLHMGLKDGGLDVKETFKLLYFGPKEMKSTITQKIGAALAANPQRASTRDGPGSARVTVVPISSFDDDSPEVVMIESGGFDMVIEECVDTRLSTKPNAKLEDMTLILESGNTLDIPDGSGSSNNDQVTDLRHRMPDLSVIYLPERSYSSVEAVPKELKWNCMMLQRLLFNQGLPFYVISDIDWLDDRKFYHVLANVLTPHRSVEALVKGKPRTWKYVPIDINTFLALDATQIHQNLVALKAQRLQFLSSQRWVMHPLVRRTQSARKAVSRLAGDTIARIRQLSLAVWVSVAILLGALIISSLLNPLSDRGSRADLHPAPIHTPSKPIETVSIPDSVLTKVQGGLQAVPTAKALGDLLAREPSRDPPGVRARKKSKGGKSNDSKEPEPQRSILVRVVGDSHILIRSSKPKSGIDPLKFESKRKGKQLKHNLQKIDNEYCVLEIPPADAYGLIEIRIWTSVKPMYNETFEIDLGFPWFKVKGWKEMAEEAMEKTTTEAQTLHEQFWSTLQHGNAAYEGLKQRESVTQLVEKVTSSMRELEDAARSGSSELLRRSFHNSLRLRKRLSRTLRRLQRSSVRQSTAAREQQMRVNKELAELRRLMGKTLHSQRLQFEKAFAALQKRVDAQFPSTAREQQLRRVQKSLLRAWWKVGGRPEEGKSKKRR